MRTPTNESPLEGLIGPDKAAAILGTDIPGLKRLRLRGLIPSVRLGIRTVRYRPSDIATAIERLRRPAVWERTNGRAAK